MADTERTKFRGRLAEKEEERQKLKLRIDANRDSLRDALDPFAGPEEMNGERIAHLALELANALIDYSAVTAEIAAIKKALGVN